MHRVPLLILASTVLHLSACTQEAPIPAATPEPRIVDLSHAYATDSLYWPTDTRGFQFQQLAWGMSDSGWFYSANAFCTAEHGGTHIDAPLHFSEQGLPVNEVPLTDLVGPAVVIDVSAEASGDPDYRLTLEAVARHEAQHGRIPQGAIVLLRSGWSARWPDARSYLGDDTPGDASKLSFPGYGEEAATWLIEERGAPVLGIDTASIDYGRSKDFPVHRIVAARQVSGLENLTNLQELPPTGFTLIALPMKIAGGSGGPVRVIALLAAD